MKGVCHLSMRSGWWICQVLVTHSVVHATVKTFCIAKYHVASCTGPCHQRTIMEVWLEGDYSMVLDWYGSRSRTVL